MPRFDFTSPGAAFTGEISRVLSERKAEERQRLIDSLQFSADQRAQQALERENAESEFRMNEARRNETAQKFRDATQFMEEGTDPTGLAPDVNAYGQSIGAFTKRPVPQVTSTISGMTDESGVPTEGFVPEAAPISEPQTRLGYTGNAEQRKLERQRDAAGKIISQLFATGEKEKIDAGLRLASWMGLNDGVMTPEMYEKANPRPKPYGVFDAGTGEFKAKGTMPGDMETFTKPQKPAGYYTERAVQPIGVGEDGYNQFLPPGSNTPINFKTKPAGAQNLPLGIPQNAYDDFRTEIQMLKVDPETGMVADPMSMLTARLAAAQMVSSMKGATPTVKQIVTTFITDPDASAQMHKEAMANGTLSAQDNANIKQVIQTLGGATTAELFRRNKPMKFERYE